MIMKHFKRLSMLLLALSFQQGYGQEKLGLIEKLVRAEPKPFVVVEASGKNTQSRGQGVLISEAGHVLSVGHVAWIGDDKAFTNAFRVSFRGTGKNLPSGAVHKHKVVFNDRENQEFLEHYYKAELLMQEKKDKQNKQSSSRFIAGGDLAVFKIEAVDDKPFPKMEFFSKKKPSLKIGDTLHLCHYSFPHEAGNPLFLINPMEVVGVAKTSSGVQYLAKGYYRVGSSGGAILKDGKLIGIQSAAYTVNAKGIGEVPAGLISFELVWEDMFEGVISTDKPKSGTGAKK